MMADGVNPGNGARLLILARTPPTKSGRQGGSGASREHQLIWAGARTGEHD